MTNQGKARDFRVVEEDLYLETRLITMIPMSDVREVVAAPTAAEAAQMWAHHLWLNGDVRSVYRIMVREMAVPAEWERYIVELIPSFRALTSIDYETRW